MERVLIIPACLCSHLQCLSRGTTAGCEAVPGCAWLTPERAGLMPAPMVLRPACRRAQSHQCVIKGAAASAVSCLVKSRCSMTGFIVHEQSLQQVASICRQAGMQGLLAMASNTWVREMDARTAGRPGKQSLHCCAAREHVCAKMR